MLETMRKIWSFASRRHKEVCFALTCSFFRSVMGLTQLLAILQAVDVLTGQLPAKTGILRIALLTVLCIVGNFAATFYEQTYTMRTGFYMTADKRVEMGGLLRRLPLGYFNQSSTGRITAALTTTLSDVENGAVMVMIGIVSGMFSSLTLFCFMLFYNWRIGLLSGVGMLCYLLLVSYQMQLSRKHAPALQKAQTTLADSALTFLQGIRVTKAFCAERGDAKLQDAIEGSRRENIRLTRTSMPSQYAAGIVIALFESAILLSTLWMHFSTGELDLVHTIVLLLFSFMVYASLNQAGSMLSMIGLMDSSLDALAEIEKAEPLTQARPVQTAADNRVELKDVSFAYGENPVLHHVSAVLEPNRLTALVGPSGSGKTTLCQLIPRFRDVTDGCITIGGADVRHMAEADLMAKISMVFQNVYLFEDTVANNIRFGRPDADMEQVQAAAKAAHCHDFIMQLPNGYDTMVEEGGSNLSGGEKQRISIARAMLKDAPIILLDEATSALDAENESEILAALEALTRNKTVMMIAHRIQTVEKADKILVLNQGRLVQQGTHEQLKAQPGLYADFIRARTEAAGWRL